jgi:SAM-dependent methyltransferase
MQGYDASTYGERIAEVYDELYPPSAVVQPMVAALAELARGGRTLELGIGTERVALPLAARGIEVHGIDASRAMIAKLRGKEGGATIPVHLGDFAEVGNELGKSV